MLFQYHYTQNFIILVIFSSGIGIFKCFHLSLSFKIDWRKKHDEAFLYVIDRPGKIFCSTVLEMENKIQDYDFLCWKM